MKPILIALLLCAGCAQHETRAAVEPGTVVDLVYVPSGTGTSTGFTTSGHLSFDTVEVAARYGVAFECPHGRFTIEGARGEQLYKRGDLHKGDKVQIAYSEEFKVRDDGVRELVKLHFIDATRAPAEPTR